MICPKCNSENVKIDTLMEVKEKPRKGLIYWLLIGWWLELMLWFFLTLPKLLFAIFGKHTKVTSKAVTYCTCQSCGYRWKV